MMRRTFGAPLGGTTLGGQYGVDSVAVSLITPPNGSGGGGSCFPSIVTVALGEPGTPVICWAEAGRATESAAEAIRTLATRIIEFVFMLCPHTSGRHSKWILVVSSLNNTAGLDSSRRPPADNRGARNRHSMDRHTLRRPRHRKLRDRQFDAPRPQTIRVCAVVR